MAITRRVFLKNGALAVVGTSVIPSFLTRAVYGAQTAAGGSLNSKRLVVLFQRGAADGLNIVVPHAEQAYYNMRPSIAIPRPRNGGESVIDLDGFFGLHPSNRGAPRGTGVLQHAPQHRHSPAAQWRRERD